MKALYIPTNTNTFIVKEIDNDFVEILLDGEYKVVPSDEVRALDDEAKVISSVPAFIAHGREMGYGHFGTMAVFKFMSVNTEALSF